MKMTILTMSLIIPTMLILLNKMNKINTNQRETMTNFECGFDTFANARVPFSLHFFLIMIIFLIFDLEIIFLLPFSSLFLMTTTSICWMMFFLSILFIGTMHEWSEGSLNWT